MADAKAKLAALNKQIDAQTSLEEEYKKTLIEFLRENVREPFQSRLINALSSKRGRPPGAKNKRAKK